MSAPAILIPVDGGTLRRAMEARIAELRPLAAEEEKEHQEFTKWLRPEPPGCLGHFYPPMVFEYPNRDELARLEAALPTIKPGEPHYISTEEAQRLGLTQP